MDSKQLNNFFRVPRLPNDGKGFVIWKERVKLSIRARGLFGHLDGSAMKLEDPPMRAVGATLTEDKVTAIGKHAKDLNTYLQEQVIVFQQIASTIPDSLYLKIKGKPTVQEAWNVMKADFEKRSQMITVELQKKLQDVRCAENGNIRTHFNNIRSMREELASLGAVLSEEDFSAIILGSLPKTYNQFLSAITATASILNRELKPEDLMQTVINEYDHRSTRQGTHKKRSTDTAFFAGNN